MNATGRRMAKELAYLAAPGPGDDNWYIAEFYRGSAVGRGAAYFETGDAGGEVRWSPDGKSIAFIGGLMSDEGSTGGDIYALLRVAAPVQDLTPQRKSSPNWFRWTPSSKQILMTEDVSGKWRFQRWIWRREAWRPFGRARIRLSFRAMRAPAR